MNKVESALSRTTDTKALVIGTETLPQVADMFRKLFPDKRALVVADANTWRVAGDDVHKILAGAGVAQDEPYVFTDPKLYAEWAYVGAGYRALRDRCRARSRRLGRDQRPDETLFQP